LRRADAVLTGGVEEFCEEILLSFYKLGYLSGMDTEDLCVPPLTKEEWNILLREQEFWFSKIHRCVNRNAKSWRW